MIGNFIIWDVKPIIFTLGKLSIRWYGMLFVMGFILAPRIGEYIYKTENKPVKDLEKAILYIMISTIIGARLGHVIFYDLSYYLKHPIEAILPISFNPSFHITGYQGLASHGATISIIIGVYIFSKYEIKSQFFPPKFSIKKQPRKNQSFLWLISGAAIIIALACFFIRMGNFMNSEIYGKPTNSKYGILFAQEINEPLRNRSSTILDIKTVKLKNQSSSSKKLNPIQINITFKKGHYNEIDIRSFLENIIKKELVYNRILTRHISENSSVPLSYSIDKDKKGRLVAHIITNGIPRHPAQLYEAVSCLILFFILFFWWKKKWKTLKEGYLIGTLLIYIFGLRFLYEFVKESKIMPGFSTLTRPHILSIIAIVGGILFLIFAKKPRRLENDTEK